MTVDSIGAITGLPTDNSYDLNNDGPDMPDMNTDKVGYENKYTKPGFTKPDASSNSGGNSDAPRKVNSNYNPAKYLFVGQDVGMNGINPNMRAQYASQGAGLNFYTTV